jgi:hypothetical protein
MLSSRAKILAFTAAAIGAAACSDQPGAPCPKPWAGLAPAAAETVAVGEFASFWIPLDVSLDHRRIAWSSDRPSVASVPIDANPRLAAVRAIAAGTATILASDENSVSNCPDIWGATVVVR